MKRRCASRVGVAGPDDRIRSRKVKRLTDTRSLLVYKVHTYNKLQTLQSLTTNLLIIFFLFCNVNLTWLNLYSNVVSNDYTFIVTNTII
jgi:hypothetical protein